MSAPGKLLLTKCGHFKKKKKKIPSTTMEALKFVAVLLLVVVVQMFGALGISSDEEDGEVLMVENWQVKRKCSQKRVLRWIPFF